MADAGGAQVSDRDRPSGAPESRGPSEHISLEVAVITGEIPRHRPGTSDPGGGVPQRVVLVVVASTDVRAYVSDSLRRRGDLAVYEVGSVASALDVAERRRLALLVVGESEAAVVRHLPAIPAILLADEAPPRDPSGERRPAPLVLVRGVFSPQRLLEAVELVLGAEGAGGTSG